MTDVPTQPDALREQVQILRDAAAHAPMVIRGTAGIAAGEWLLAEASCHESVPEVAAAAVDLVDSVGKSDRPSEIRVAVSTLGSAVEFARSVLRLEVVEPELAQLREENRKLEERVAETRELNQGWVRYGDRKKAERREQQDAFRAALGLDEFDRTRHIPLLIEKVAALRAGHVDEVTGMVRDLNAALFDGSTLLPDRPLDTVWEYLLDCVRSDRARLSSPAAKVVCADGPACPEHGDHDAEYAAPPAASRSGRGEVPDDTAAVDLVAKNLFRVGGLYSDDLSPETVERRWSNGLEDDDREAWRGHARALLGLLAESGWGAVTNPTDGEAGDVEVRVVRVVSQYETLELVLAHVLHNNAHEGDGIAESCSFECRPLARDLIAEMEAAELLDIVGDVSPTEPVVPAPTQDAGAQADAVPCESCGSARCPGASKGFDFCWVVPAPPAVSEEERDQDDADREQADALRPAPAVRPADLFERVDGLDGRYVCVCGDRIPDREHHWRGSWVCLPRDHSAQPPVAPVTAQPEETRTNG